MKAYDMNETTVLIVGHGSRDPRGNDEIRRFVADWSRRHPDWSIETCFIEFDEVLIDDGLERAAERSPRVVVVPLILNAAGHVKHEIPAFIDGARRRHPATEFVYAPHLGANEAVLTILRRRLREAMQDMDMPDPRTTGVVLLGRGSSDASANGEVAKMARWLFEGSGHELVDIAFTGITFPRLEQVVQRQHRLGMRQIAILPYYLFTGRLIARIGRQVERLRRQYPELAIALTDYIGFETEIHELVDERVASALSDEAPAIMPCDACPQRGAPASGQAHHEHHHHDPEDRR